MNHNFSLLFFFFLIIASCSKKKEAGLDKLPVSSKALLGKWTFTEYYLSIGGPGSWYPVQPSGQTIEFEQDGTFQSTTAFSNTFNRYEIMDSVKVKFTPAPTASGYVLMEYKFDAADRTLILIPVDPICIEGCSNKFTR